VLPVVDPDDDTLDIRRDSEIMKVPEMLAASIFNEVTLALALFPRLSDQYFLRVSKSSRVDCTSRT